MPVNFDNIKKLVIAAIANYDQFMVIVAKAQSLYDDSRDFYNKIIKEFTANDELDLDSLESNEDVLAALETKNPDGAYGAIDGSRLRAIIKFVKDNPELLKILIALI